ncbi:MAG: zf-TFIIB domain-containing protein [Kofleriaceae bacterium]
MSEAIYRTTSRSCPRCATRLVDHPKERWACERCGGVWIGDLDIRELVYALAPDLDLSVTVFEYTTRPTRAPLPCPECADPLRPVRFGGVALDRCDKDGRLWFDGEELAKVLHAIGFAYANRETRRNDRFEHRIDASIPLDGFLQHQSEQWRPGHEAEPGEDGVLGFLRTLLGKKRPPDP